MLNALFFNYIINLPFRCGCFYFSYVYGAVAAPDFVLPLAAFGIIAIAAVPFLLAPGEEALAQQREDEATKGAGFNQRKNRDLR